MATIGTLKEQVDATLPILLLKVTFSDASIFRWSSEAVSFGGNDYDSRIMEIPTFQMQSKSEVGLDSIARMRFVFNNAAQFFSTTDASKGFKGAQVEVRLAIFEVDPVLGTFTASSDSRVVFLGYFDSPSLDSDTTFEIEAINYFNMERVVIPPVRVQRHDPYLFPLDSTDRTAGLTDRNSIFWNFPYSPDIEDRTEAGGAMSINTNILTISGSNWTADDTARTVSVPTSNFGSGVVTAQIIEVISATQVRLDKITSAAVSGQTISVRGYGKLDTGEVVFADYDGTKREAVERGMYGKNIRPTAPGFVGHQGFFGGVQFVPSVINVKSFGDRETFDTPVEGNKAKYGRRIPLAYGIVEAEPLIVFQRGEANETKIMAMLSWGEIDSVQRVLVDNVNIPRFTSNSNPDNYIRGFYAVLNSKGERGQIQQPNFPQGDPFGGIAYIFIQIPRVLNNGSTIPRIQVRMRGRLVETLNGSGTSLGWSWSQNPIWVLYDILKMSRWPIDKINGASFNTAAAVCDASITQKNNNGSNFSAPRFRFNAYYSSPRSAFDVINGIRGNCRAIFFFDSDGKLNVRIEGKKADNGGSQYTFDESTMLRGEGFPSDYLGRPSTLVRTSLPISETRNALQIDFQDSLNNYIQDSAKLHDLPDQQAVGQEISGVVAADGIPNFDQAFRILRFNLEKSVNGNLFYEFVTTAKALATSPGDIVTLDNLKKALSMVDYRVVRIEPSSDWRTAKIVTQIHDENWYEDTLGQDNLPDVAGSGRNPNAPGSQQLDMVLGPSFSISNYPSLASTLDSPGWTLTEIVRATTHIGGLSFLLNAVVQLPVRTVTSKASPPIIDLSPSINTTGGTIPGDQDLYYAFTGLFNNFLTRSEELDVAADWSRIGAGGGAAPTLTANATTDPNGATTAEQIDFPATGVGETSRIRQNAASVIPDITSREFTFSVYLRANSSISITLLIDDGVSGTTEVADLTTSWQRFEVTRTTDPSAGVVRADILQDQSQSAKTVFAWGAQLEYGDTASEYIKTIEDPVEEETTNSFISRAEIPAGTSTNQTTITLEHTDPDIASFNVYRGTHPNAMFRIGDGGFAIASSFNDTGGTALQFVQMPEAFLRSIAAYFRLQNVVNTTADVFSSRTIGKTSSGWAVDQFAGDEVRIESGTGEGQRREVLSNTSDTLTVDRDWNTTPDGTSTFVVSEKPWRFGARSRSNSVTFTLPNEAGKNKIAGTRTMDIQVRPVDFNEAEPSEESLPIQTHSLFGNEGTIDQQFLVANPSFELGDRKWTKGTGFTIENDGANAYDGDWVGKHVGTANSSIGNDIFIAMQPGDVLMASCVIKRVAGDGNPSVRIVWYDSAKSALSSTVGNVVTSSTYALSRVIGTAPASTNFAQVQALSGAPTASQTAYYDQFQASFFPQDLGEVPDGEDRFARTGAHSSYRPLTNPLTAVDAGATASIVIASFTMRVAGTDVSITGSTLTSLSFETLYFIRYDDATLAGGSVTFVEETTKEAALDGDDRFYVGSIRTPVDDTGTTGVSTVGNNDGGAGAQIGGEELIRPTSESGTYTGGTAAFDGNSSTSSDGHDDDVQDSPESAEWSGFAASAIAPQFVVSKTLKVESEVIETGSGLGNVRIRRSINGGSSWTTFYDVGNSRSKQINSFPLAVDQDLTLVKVDALTDWGSGVSVEFDHKVYEIWIEVKG